jgi:hypothetical protein
MKPIGSREIFVKSEGCNIGIGVGGKGNRVYACVCKIATCSGFVIGSGRMYIEFSYLGWRKTRRSMWSLVVDNK